MTLKPNPALVPLIASGVAAAVSAAAAVSG